MGRRTDSVELKESLSVLGDDTERLCELVVRSDSTGVALGIYVSKAERTRVESGANGRCELSVAVEVGFEVSLVMAK